jgi:hypothetical protein
MCSYTSSLMTTTSVGRSSSARRAMSSPDQTVPLGLCGELTMIALVFAPSAAPMRSKSGRNVPGRSGTWTVRPPASSTLGA